MNGQRKNVRGLATRQLILASAERLFAERGIESVPLRDIGVDAGQRNHAVVQYHFGDREQLVREIVEFRGNETDQVRAGMVADFTMGDRAPTLIDIMRAFVLPLSIHLESDNHYLAFLSRYIIEEGGYEGLSRGSIQAGASVVTLQTLVARIVPDMPEHILDERWLIAQTSAVHALARYQAALRKRGRLPAPRDELLAALVSFLAAGIVAPLGPGMPATSNVS